MIPVDILKTTMVDKLPTDLEGMEASMERLLALVDEVYKYVDNVVVRRHYLLHCVICFLLDMVIVTFSLSGRACCTG